MAAALTRRRSSPELDADAGQFGSLPSLHVTWALWVAVACQAVVSHRALRTALWAYPALTVLDVIATANHYLLDVITAPAVLVLAYAIAALPALGRRQWHLSRPRRSTPRRAPPAKVPPQLHPRVTPSLLTSGQSDSLTERPVPAMLVI